MTNHDARPEQNVQGPGHLEERPTLDSNALRGLGLSEIQIIVIMQGSSCVSEQELYDRWRLMEMEGKWCGGGKC